MARALEELGLLMVRLSEAQGWKWKPGLEAYRRGRSSVVAGCDFARRFCVWVAIGAGMADPQRWRGNASRFNREKGHNPAW
jgi:hypothetical protein